MFSFFIDPHCFATLVRLICIFNELMFFEDETLFFLKKTIEDTITQKMRTFKTVDCLTIIIQTILHAT